VTLAIALGRARTIVVESVIVPARELAIVAVQATVPEQVTAQREVQAIVEVAEAGQIVSGAAMSRAAVAEDGMLSGVVQEAMTDRKPAPTAVEVPRA
jgi:hypothetical protein